MKIPKTVPYRLSGAQIVAGWLYLIAEFTVLPPLLFTLRDLLMPALSDAGVHFVFYGLNAVCVAALFRGMLRRSLAVLKKNWHSCLLTASGMLVLYFITRLLTARLTLLIRPDFINVNDKSVSGLMEQNFSVMALSVVLLVPLAEECLFRGLIFLQLLPKSRLAAYLCSAAAFSFVHVFSYIGTVDAGGMLLFWAQYLPAGLILCFSFHKSQSVFVPILIHTLINAFGIFAMR